MSNPLVDHDGLVLVAGRLRAWKVARLRLGGFAGQWSPIIYGAHDLAVCNRIPDHVPPHPGCTCGFYAVRHRAAAIRRLEPDVPALLEVELAGRFDEYERGYVAAVQHVVGAAVVQACSQCLADGRLKPAVLLGDAGGRAESYGLEPVCPTTPRDTTCCARRTLRRSWSASTWSGSPWRGRSAVICRYSSICDGTAVPATSASWLRGRSATSTTGRSRPTPRGAGG